MRKNISIISIAMAMLAVAAGDPYDYKKTVQRRVPPVAVTTNAARRRERRATTTSASASC